MNIKQAIINGHHAAWNGLGILWQDKSLILYPVTQALSGLTLLFIAYTLTIKPYLEINWDTIENVSTLTQNIISTITQHFTEPSFYLPFLIIALLLFFLYCIIGIAFYQKTLATATGKPISFVQSFSFVSRKIWLILSFNFLLILLAAAIATAFFLPYYYAYSHSQAKSMIDFILSHVQYLQITLMFLTIILGIILIVASFFTVVIVNESLTFWGSVKRSFKLGIRSIISLIIIVLVQSMVSTYLGSIKLLPTISILLSTALMYTLTIITVSFGILIQFILAAWSNSSLVMLYRTIERD